MPPPSAEITGEWVAFILFALAALLVTLLVVSLCLWIIRHWVLPQLKQLRKRTSSPQEAPWDAPNQRGRFD